MKTIQETAQTLPVLAEADVCVIGGSCTGVFAAVRAARLGASVVLLERANAFGGVATHGLVSIWHSLRDTEFKQPIIGGLTVETIDRLLRRDAAVIRTGKSNAYCELNTEELKIELDELVREHNITPMLHTLGCRPLLQGDRLDAVLVENKDGRGAVRARVFIDATGDGDIAFRAGVPSQVRDDVQPPTTCSKIWRFHPQGKRFADLYKAHHAAFGLEPDSGWDSPVPGLSDIRMVAQTHVFGANIADAAELTAAEMEGRRQTRAMIDLLRTHGDPASPPVLVQLASCIGGRETRILDAAHCLTEQEVLHGKRFPDAIANGSYRVDVHAPQGGGFLFKYLDGTTLFAHNNGSQEGRWRDPTPENPTFYQIPYRCLYHPSFANLLFAGRMICADRGAFGAVRVMVNLNQTGEAAGVAAALAARDGIPVSAVDSTRLRRQLADGGSIIL